MAQLSRLLVFFLYSVSSDFGLCVSVQVILGDPVTFPNVSVTGEPAKLYRVGHDGTRPVASLEGGVWTPAEGYEDRGNRSSSFTLSRTVFSDTGLYQLVCGPVEENIQLDVLVGFYAPVTEGDPLRLQCYYITTGTHVDSIRWDKHGETVLERDLASGNIKYGAKYKGRVTLSPGGDKQGNWSLVLNQAQLEDEGDYFCSAFSKGVREGRGDPAAVRVKVERKPDQSTTRPHLTPTQSAPEEKMESLAIVAITAAVVSVIVAPLFFLLGWWLKSKSKERYSPVANGGPQQASGRPHQASGLNSSDEVSTV